MNFTTSYSSLLHRNLWKILLSFAILFWALSELVPVHNVPFAEFAKGHATAKQAELAKLADDATARKKAAATQSEFVALKQIGQRRQLDFSEYFPDIRLESSLKN